jgi:hypothetical protein
MKQFFSLEDPLHSWVYGPSSPLWTQVEGDLQFSFEFQHSASLPAVLNVFRTGTIPTDIHNYKKDWLGLDKYLDIRLLYDIINGGWEKKEYEYLQFYKRSGFNNYTGVSSYEAAKGGHLETLK